MDRRFRFTDARFGKLQPLLPTDTRGAPRVDDRRVVSGIAHVLRAGRAAGACPSHAARRAPP